MRRSFCLALFCAAALSAKPRFDKDVYPLLARHCLSCHGAAVKMGNLDLRTLPSMLEGGSKGPAVAPGKSSASLLIARITEGSMPPGQQKMAASELAVLREWIDSGAEASPIAQDPASHWSFQSPRRPPIPRVQGTARTAVDNFLLAALEARGFTPAAPAGRETLLRRAYINLLGLPPSPAEQAAFLGDNSPDAWRKLVESLLARPQYGERWARHWLDTVRYGESNGYERDGTKPHAWRYRDYVIRAFNQDKPFDRFVTEQLAGDELPDTNAETQIATTFLRLGTWDDEPAEPAQDRYDQLDDILAASSTAFLGLTLRCARCHDHKFEPFSQKDYYRVLSVFTPLKRPQDDRKDLDRLVGTASELASYAREKEKADGLVKDVERKIETQRKDLLKRLFAHKAERTQATLSFLDHAEVVLAFATEEKRRNKEQKQVVEKFNAQLDTALRAEATAVENGQLDEWKRDIAAIDAARSPEPPRAYVWYEEGPDAPRARLLERGDPSRPGEEVAPGVPTVIAGDAAAPPAATARSSGRRLWFAQWLTRRDNPLLARVIVNRLWQWHFGEGLVATENDFGVAGARPTHPELLDYLATELIDSGWSVKHIQRLILNSAAFQRTSEWNAKAGAADAGNSLLWRWKPRRIDAEAVRDSMLAAAGHLNSQMSGASIFPELPRAVLEGQSRPGDGWGKSAADQASRRSVYIFVKRSLAVPELEALDSPDTASSCEQRTVSTTGPQALTFLNGDFTHRQARGLAARVVQEAAGWEARIARAYQIALQRAPEAEERKAASAFLDGYGGAQQSAFEAFCLVLLNSNEFFYLN